MNAGDMKPSDWPPVEELYVGRAEPIPFGGGFGWKITIKNRGGYWQQPRRAEEVGMQALQQLLEKMSCDPSFNPHLREEE